MRILGKSFAFTWLILAAVFGYRGANLWFALGPGLAISLTVLGCNLLGDAL